MPKWANKDFWGAFILLSIFILFLGYAGHNQSLCFDACYNLISYQNVFLGKGFGYNYNGQWFPFDPVISTGPELYLPTLFIWFLTGSSSYWSAIYVLVFYYVIFCLFLFFYVLKDTRTKFFACLLLFFVFFCRLEFFRNDAAFITPIGEPLSVFFIFSGIYLLLKKKTRILAFLLIGLGLDTKTNTVIGILPVLAAIYFVEFFYPSILKKDYKQILKDSFSFVIGAILVLGPMFAYTTIAPNLFLNDKDKAIWEKSVKDRKAFMLERGFGHIVESIRKDDLQSAAVTYAGIFKSKIIQSKSFFHNSYTITTLYFVLFLALLYFSFRHKHFSSYIFLFSFFVYIWWFFGAGDAWYRYLSVADFMVLYGIVSLAPLFYERMQTPGVITMGVLSLFVFLPQFSFESVYRHMGNTFKADSLKMADKISDINEKQIFTYGWFQAPSFMILTEKRFQDFIDTNKLSSAISEFDEVFFLSTVENTMIAEEMKMLEPILIPVAEFGFNKLYKINPDKTLMSSVKNNLENNRR